ncbi:hypothetical protein IV203_033743 [Nitzschia inconspicua]|uniref:Uncharacterized protein n=1 Tax=Nitzschia inconspicua TaxID=303405 RepID=A0A9K3Q9C4_9STRA|nr:hypothetical protein IV203_033743 [Nitzschia inconspicua]
MGIQQGISKGACVAKMGATMGVGSPTKFVEAPLDKKWNDYIRIRSERGMGDNEFIDKFRGQDGEDIVESTKRSSRRGRTSE